MTEQRKPVLLTAAEAKALYISAGSAEAFVEGLNERGLIAREQALTDEDHAWQVCADHGYRFRNSHEHQLATAALRRGMELRPELTRERVREACLTAGLGSKLHYGDLDRLHAALTEPQP